MLLLLDMPFLPHLIVIYPSNIISEREFPSFQSNPRHGIFQVSLSVNLLQFLFWSLRKFFSHYLENSLGTLWFLCSQCLGYHCMIFLCVNEKWTSKHHVYTQQNRGTFSRVVWSCYFENYTVNELSVKQQMKLHCKMIKKEPEKQKPVLWESRVKLLPMTPASHMSILLHLLSSSLLMLLGEQWREI